MIRLCRFQAISGTAYPIGIVYEFRMFRLFRFSAKVCAGFVPIAKTARHRRSSFSYPLKRNKRNNPTKSKACGVPDVVRLCRFGRSGPVQTGGGAA